MKLKKKAEPEKWGVQQTVEKGKKENSKKREKEQNIQMRHEGETPMSERE